jgi:hypothetical protein
VCVALALIVYRAKTQSFTIDEAFTFNLFVDRELGQFALVYDACNHVLHTLLTKFFRYWLGTSELVLRLASVLGAVLYLVAARRLSRLAAGSGWTHVIGLTALAFNPLILDFMVAARGYGLAVALFLWAVYYSVRWLNEGEAGLLLRAGVAAGLSIAANLTLLVPAAGLGATLLILAARGRFWMVIDRYGGPSVVIAFVFLVLPLARSAPDNFYLGTNTLSESLDSLWDASFRYHEWRSPLPECEACAFGGRYVLLPVLFTALMIGGLMLAVTRHRTNRQDLNSDLLVLCTLTLGLSLAAVVLANRLLHVPFPFARSGLYMIPLFILCVLTAAGLLLRSRYRLAGQAAAAVVAISATLFIAQWNTRYFSIWRFDASTNKLSAVIAADRKGRELEPFIVASSSVYGETLKYYRRRRRLHAMAQDIITANLEKAQADYFVLTPNERDLIDKLKLHVLAEDPFSGGIVARKS